MAKLQTQLRNAAEIREILQKVDISYTWENESIDVHLIYLPCVNGKCDTLSLFRVIKKCLMANFVLSHKAIQSRLEIINPKSDEELFKSSVRFISKKTAHGELGELLLFTLLDVYLGAPKILSKISMKTSPKMPVYGADAVHAQYVDGVLRLYLGESKLYKSFKSATRKAIHSISDALSNYEHEFTLIEHHIDFPEINDDIAQDIINILNPFNTTNIHADILYSPCFIGFAEPSCFLDEIKYIDIYKKIACEYIEYYFGKLKIMGIHCSRTTLLMLPFSSVSDIVKDFIDYMGIKK
ncbi:MAG: DUF1837 domain-containing protein [Prevotellaceae bacterium]|nr:DUF1837 domain-containing protein [Prevotellaceae bacterium]